MDVYKHFEHSNAVVYSAQKSLLVWQKIMCVYVYVHVCVHACVHPYMYVCKHACDFTCSSYDSMIAHEVQVIPHAVHMIP